MCFPLQALLQGFQLPTRSVVTLHLFVLGIVCFLLHMLSDLHKVAWYDAVVVNLISAHEVSKAHFLVVWMILEERADGTSWAGKQNQSEKGIE